MSRLTFAAVPYRDRPELTCALIDQLATEQRLHGLYLLNHASGPDTEQMIDEALIDAGIKEVLRIPFDADTTLTTMWNAAWDQALADGVDTLAFLNNDIVLPQGFFSVMEQRLWEASRLWLVSADWRDPRPASSGVRAPTVRVVSGSERHGGITGAAFMVKVKARTEGLPPIDEQFRWWAGDDDLAFAIEAAGYCCGVVEGVPFDHMRSATLTRRPELIAICEEDLARCLAKWGK